jgi:hypothetical protein
MKNLLLFLALSVLAACSSETRQDSATNEIWKLYMQTDAFDISTDEFVQTTRRENEFIFMERNGDEIIYHECDQKRKMTGEITDSGILIWDLELLESDNNLYQGQINRFEASQDHYYNTLATLRKIQDGTTLDLGALIIDGPVELSESNFVCTYYSEVPDLNWQIIGLRVPYSDRFLQFDLVYTDQISTGVYDWNKNDQTSPIITFNVNSSSEEFYSITGTNGLVPDKAQFNITKLSDDSISGSVSFNAMGGQSFSVQFVADLLPLEP